MLHRDSLLGDQMVLECYLTGQRNVFVLGFVPCKDEEAVVILARDVAANPATSAAANPQLKDMDLDLAQWQQIIAAHKPKESED